MAAAIFFLSSLVSKELPQLGSWDVLVKKGGHALGYGVLAAAIWYGFAWSKRLWWVALLLAVLYAITDELHQSFVSGRHPSRVDVAIDIAGSAVTIAACALVRRRQGR